MNIGPIQLIALGFERTDKFKGRIMRELEEIKSRGVIRVLDLLFVMKDENGDIVAFEDTDLSPEEARCMRSVNHLVIVLLGSIILIQKIPRSIKQ